MKNEKQDGVFLDRWAFVKHDDITNHSLSHDHLECFV